MGTRRLNIIVDAEYEGSRDIKQASDDIEGLGDETEQTSTKSENLKNNFASLATGAAALGGAFVTIAAGAKKAWEAIERGAEVEATKNTFDALAESIGTTSDALTMDLRQATQGTVADFELMQSANMFMSMGLATTADEVAELSNVAVALGGAMGSGPVQSMEDFGLMLANQSIPRLDTFGISSSKVRERMNELTTGINAVDRETAFMTATMEEATLAMERNGDATENTANDIARFNAAKQNISDKASLEFMGQWAPMLGGVSDMMQTLEGNQVRLNEAAEAGIITQEEADSIYQKQLWTFSDWGGRGAEVIGMLDELEAAQAKATEEAIALAEASTYNAQSMEWATTEGSNYAAAIQEMQVASDAAVASIEAQNAALVVATEEYETLSSFLEGVDATAQTTTESMSSLAVSIIESSLAAEVAAGNLTPLEAALSSINAQEGMGLIGGAEADSLRDTAEQFAVVDEVINTMTESMIEGGGITVEEAERMSDAIDLAGTAVTDADEDMRLMAVHGSESLATVSSDFVNVRDEVDNAAISVGTLKDLIIDGLPDEKVIKIKIETEGMGNIPANLGTDLTSDVMQSAGVN